MASALTVEKVSNPSLTGTFIEPYLTCGVTDKFKSTNQPLSTYSSSSLQMGLQLLRKQIKRRQSEENIYPIRKNGYSPQTKRESHVPILGGNGLFTIFMSYYTCQKEEISFLDHASRKVTCLGQFPVPSFYRNSDRFECCPRAPRCLCGLTQDGNHFALLGPWEFTRSRYPQDHETPSIAIYQLAPPMCLFNKLCKNTPFIKCDPFGIAINPSSIMHGQYQVAIVTEKMTVFLLNVTTSKHSTLKLESVSPQFYIKVHSYNAPQENNCITFSPDGEFLSLMCCMNQESTPACLIIDVCTMEPRCWMAADGHLMWLRWLFPMFSPCGTKVVLCTYSDYQNYSDETEYKLTFYKISGIKSLKVLCRVVILECVQLSLLDQLPLPHDMVVFLGGARTTTTTQDLQLFKEYQSLDVDVERRSCKCNLL